MGNIDENIKNKNWFKEHKIISGLIIFTIFVAIIVLSRDGDQDEQAKSEVASTAPVSEEAPDLSQASTPEEKIEAVVRHELSGMSNMDKPKFREISIVEQVDGGYGAFVDFNADDNLTANLRKGGIEKDMSQIYQALYTNPDLEVTSASASAYFPLIDQYGNEGDDVVYKSILDKTEAGKVNWNTDSSLLQLDILPGIWTTSILHREFH